MKLLFYISTIRGGGAARVMSNLANGFAASGADVTLVTSFPTENEYSLDPAVRRLNLSVQNEKSFFVRNIAWIHRLRKIIASEKPDAVISFMAEPNYRNLIACAGLKTKRIISVRNDPNKEYAGTFQRMLAKSLYGFADGIVFQTEDAQKWFPKRVQKKSCIIMNQVKAELFETNRECEEYYVALGRLAPQKNYPMMIRGFAGFLKSQPLEQLRIYGNGDAEQYSALIQELDAGKNIHFMGATADVAGVLKKAKAFLMTSDYEGMPNALLEAMAVGVPCICTDCPCGGPRAVIEDGKNGTLIPVGDANALTEALLQMDEETRKYLGGNAKLTAERFRPEKVFKMWESYIKTVIPNA